MIFLPGIILLFFENPLSFIMSFKLTPSNFLEISHRVSPFLTVYIKYSPALEAVFSSDIAETEEVEAKAEEALADAAGAPFL